uniref:Pco079824 n=1 Tax=Arundo donax TaxID=35708 RepID=A0A0A9CQQ8_ARUDO
MKCRTTRLRTIMLRNHFLRRSKCVHLQRMPMLPRRKWMLLQRRRLLEQLLVWMEMLRRVLRRLLCEGRRLLEQLLVWMEMLKRVLRRLLCEGRRLQRDLCTLNKG